jgi:hypothetical protein
MNQSSISHGLTKDVQITRSKETSQTTMEDMKLEDISGTKKGNI